MIRKRRAYAKPRKLYEKNRIEEENQILKKYGLKSKREIWKTKAKIDYLRRRAMALAKSTASEQQVLFGKLQAIGLKANASADVLGLKIEDLLERRLPVIIFKKGIAKTPQHARQLVVHKKILINGKVVNSPSYIVRVSEENNISLKVRAPKAVAVQQAPENTGGQS